MNDYLHFFSKIGFILLTFFLFLEKKIFAQNSNINIDSLQHINIEQKNIDTQVTHFIKLSEAYNHKDNLKSNQYAKIAWEKSKLLDQKKYKELVILAKFTYSTSIALQGYNYEALGYFEEILKEQPKDKKMLLRIFMQLGKTNYWIGYKNIALKYFLNVLELSSKVEIDFLVELNIYEWIARTYTSQKVFDKALFYLEKQKQFHDKKNIIDPATNSELGNVYFNKKEYNVAYKYYEEAYNFEKNHLKRNHSLGFLVGNMGLVLFRQEKYEDALQKYEESKLYFEKSNSKRDLINANSNIAQLYTKKQEYTKAISIAKEAYTEAKKIKDYPLILELGNLLATIYETLNDKTELYLYQNEKTKYYDSISSQKQENEILAISFFEKNIVKQKENQLLEEKNQRLFYSILLSILLVLTLAIIVFFVLKGNSLYKKLAQEAEEKNKIKEQLLQEAKQNALLQGEIAEEEKQKNEMQKQLLEEEISKNEIQEKYNQLEQKSLQEKIDAKNRQLTSLSALVTQKNEWLADIETQLQKQWEIMNIESRIPFRNAFKDIFGEIKKSMEVDTDWQRFQLHFEQVHHDFFEKLQIQYPKMTQNDMRLCAYLKMNLSTKEIASMLHITEGSLKVSISRLKKKLNISIDESIRTFLNNF